MSCDKKTPYAGAELMLPHRKEKLTIRIEKSPRQTFCHFVYRIMKGKVFEMQFIYGLVSKEGTYSLVLNIIAKLKTKAKRKNKNRKILYK